MMLGRKNVDTISLWKSQYVCRSSVSLVLLGALLVAAFPALGQRVQIDAAGAVTSENLGRAFETFSVFGGTPGIAAAQYYSDFHLNSFQLPIAHAFAPLGDGWLANVSPYAEVTLGYLTADETFPLTPSPTTPNSVKLSFNTWSALAGGGIELRLGSGFSLRPIVLAGYAHIGGNADFAGPNSALFQTAAHGVLNDAAVNTALLGGALELVYDKTFPGDLIFTARARYNEVAAIVADATDPSLKQNGSFGVATAGITFDGPTEWRIAARAVRWLGYVNATWLPSTNRDLLGFNAFAEIGGGLRLIAPDVIRGVQGATVRASAIVGPGVTGWLVSAALNF